MLAQVIDLYERLESQTGVLVAFLCFSEPKLSIPDTRSERFGNHLVELLRLSNFAVDAGTSKRLKYRSPYVTRI